MNTSKRMKYADELNTNGIDTLSAYVHGQAERIGNETQRNIKRNGEQVSCYDVCIV